MNLQTLALIGAVALLGPLLAASSRWRIPVVIGELVAGMIIGRTGLHLVDTTDATFSFLATLGFGLTMFVAGTHVPVRDARLRPALGRGAVHAVIVGIVAAFAGWGLAAVFDTGHAAVYAVVMASSSAALVLPAVQQTRLGGAQLLPTIAQVAIADTACILVLPLAMDPERAPVAALGALAIATVAIALALILRWADRGDRWKRLREASKRHELALELRVSLVLVCALGALATVSHVSVLLAGFAGGLAVASAGEPRRLARQLFAVTEGFLSPLYFVWLGASLSFVSLLETPAYLALGLLLGVGAVSAHLVGVLLRQHALWSIIAAAQLGVPIAAATIGADSGLLNAGEQAALVLGAIVTIVALAASAAVAARRTSFRDDVPDAAVPGAAATAVSPPSP
ncbi:cation:proton antiporter [Microbacterium sp. VKM Ac-2870]|uniref:cation:proton antiporter n=1 Tax=Microbacterium sp. VKM Ac-2870 TaxID=2783825 RepID=UPI00188C327A|nr:cation:proton antiporter [Microbacterium sp. VKM Ac-2870]MBF4561152.1 cation:proton antiporter [Microbacterium sp. VKM Ac-2870]